MAMAQKGQLSPSWEPQVSPPSPLLPALHTHCFPSLSKAGWPWPRPGWFCQTHSQFLLGGNTMGSSMNLSLVLGWHLSCFSRYAMAWLRPFPRESAVPHTLLWEASTFHPVPVVDWVSMTEAKHLRQWTLFIGSAGGPRWSCQIVESILVSEESL